MTALRGATTVGTATESSTTKRGRQAADDSPPTRESTPEIKVDTTEFISLEYIDNEDGAGVGKDKSPESRTHLKVFHLPGQARGHPVALSMAHNNKHRCKKLRNTSFMV